MFAVSWAAIEAELFFFPINDIGPLYKAAAERTDLGLIAVNVHGDKRG